MPRPNDNLRSRPIGGRLFFEVKDGAFYSVGCRDVANALLHVLYLAYSDFFSEMSRNEV